MSTVTTPVAFIKAEFFGRDGAISVPGLKVGDAVISDTINNLASNLPRALEAFVTADDEIQQASTSNLEVEPFVLNLLRGV
jgi:hypothetical protein